MTPLPPRRQRRITWADRVVDHLIVQEARTRTEKKCQPLAQLVSERRAAGVEVVAWHVRRGGR